MKKITILIILSIIIVLILIVVITSKASKNNEVEQEKKELEESLNYEVEIIMENDVYPVDNGTEFFSVASHVGIYLNCIANKDADAVYNLLAKEYITENNITASNVLEKVENITETKTFQAREMYAADSYNSRTYFVYGTIRTELYDATGNERGEEEDYYITVNVDLVDPAFSVIPNTIQNIISVKEVFQAFVVDEEGQRIPRNEHNLYKAINISGEILALTYLNDYRSNALYNVERAYDLLDEEYREKRFGSLNEYKRYLEANIETIYKIALYEYQIDYMDDYIQYMCADNRGNKYIFRETAIMQYNLMLDTYTLDLPEFLESYNSTGPQGKVALNIQKFVDSINARDYRYTYSKLADGFKTNNFSTLQSFESYIKNNLYDINKVEYMTFKEAGGLYTYEIRFINAENELEQMTKTIIMQLQGKTDFTLSFNLD